MLMMEIPSTPGSETDAIKHSSRSSCLNDDDLIDSVQARNQAISNVQLGNRLAKPSIVEQSPSAGFAFGRVDAVGVVNRRTNSEPKTGSPHGKWWST